MTESTPSKREQRNRARAERISASVNEIVERAADLAQPRLMAVVSSPHGLGRNASLQDALLTHARHRSVTVPAEGLLSEWDALVWVVGSRNALESADVVVVDGLVARESTPALRTIVRLLTGEAVEVPVEYQEPVGVALKPGFSLILSEPSRTAGAARSVLAAIVDKIATEEKDGGGKSSGRPVTVLEASL